MPYVRITLAEIDAPDHTSLLAAWKAYGATGLVGTFKCQTPLTAVQVSQLHPELRALLTPA